MNAHSDIDPVEGWRAMAAALSIAHHIPGRIRLRLSGDVASAPSGAAERVLRFARIAQDVPGIRSAKLNPLARSCVVEYDPAAIPPAAWENLAQGERTEPAERLLRLLVASSGV
ncbi:conserved hypothetical protein [uncultured Pleomorphomonas sp.]|uniref:Uncharacterized protein n=1 Tax=uncultured Pleomorphomonas sp. TaxID=442121 RepID=A0A212LF52_9HYPH|nr:cation transporter [uncultured Pleomorphomonas sp.]SCM76194.1 conserved hypothetical protein [uncultured Pleomorphomonas sp.]